jgi:hypothetical protein
VCCALVVLVILCGPVLGAASAGIMYGSHEPGAQSQALSIKAAATWVSAVTLVTPRVTPGWFQGMPTRLMMLQEQLTCL